MEARVIQAFQVLMEELACLGKMAFLGTLALLALLAVQVALVHRVKRVCQVFLEILASLVCQG